MRAIGNFIVKHRGGLPDELCHPRAGTFNITFRMKFKDGGSAILRFPNPGITMFPEEKVRNEVATMRYIQDHTVIPVPFVISSGTREESPLGLGPFIVMEYINHEMDMVDALNKPELSVVDRQCLNPNIDLPRLEMLYRQFADVLLQVSTLEFSLVGALEKVDSADDFSFEVQQRRPLSVHMNELVRLGTLPRAKLPDCTFTSSSDYFQRLAQLQFDHLTSQRNDAIESRTDCQRKYVARCLFRRLAREGRLALESHNSGPFKLWCDDLRPANTLLDANLQIAAVLDWEFTYAAPAEFSFAPPWWLLLEQAEYWPEGLDDWERTFAGRLETFLQVLVQCEDSAMAAGRLSKEQRLSCHMRESWDTGRFWIVYAARKSFASDFIFWNRLDSPFFGPASNVEDAWQQRLELLSEEELREMEAFVDKKMAEMDSRPLAWEPDENVDTKKVVS